MMWERIRRASGLVEWKCEHGIGHPDLYSASVMDKLHGHKSGTWGIHGCCEHNCCSRKDFPGSEYPRKKEE